MPLPVTVVLIQSRGASLEADAAAAWLWSLPEVEARLTTLEGLPEEIGEAASTVFWFHLWDPTELSDAVRVTVDAHVRAGGGLLATLAGALIPHRVGWERVPPNEITVGEWSDEAEDRALAKSFSVLPRVRGLQSFRGHPLFAGLGSGCYTWDPQEGEPFVRCAYGDDVWPSEGRVIAVEKSYIAMNEKRRLAWEYSVGKGQVLCVGGFVQFAARNGAHRPHLERLMRNALARVRPDARRAQLSGGEWKPHSAGVEESVGAPLPPLLPENIASLFAARDDLALEREATEEAYTLAGARALLVGSERAGLEEIWFHPVRAVTRWDLVIADGDEARRATATRYRITPDLIERRLDVVGGSVLERTVVAPEEAAVLIELAPEGTEGGPPRLHCSIETDLRLMWPYPAGAAGRLIYQVAEGAVGIGSEMGDWVGIRFDPPPATLEVDDASDGERSRLRVRAELSLEGPVRVLLAGAGHAERPRALDLAGWPARRQARASRFRTASSLVEAPGELRDAVEWAMWRLSTYRVRVPGLGASLVAGHGRSRGGRFLDGRPGFAWFFARDALWSGLAYLTLGQHQIVGEVLEFLGRHQDMTGKILHECTTSGVIHYDAADSTPLYLLLTARYLAASGDEATLRREWPRVLAAYEFCLTTDGDGDGLIENTGVGHGWVEFGPLGGNHVSLYLAGVWVAALTELEAAARRLGDARLAEELAYRAAAARSSLELAFFDPLEGRYATGLRADGSRNMAESVMTAVPLLLGVIRPERCDAWLDRVASDAFTAPWGVRIMPNDHPDYDPGGYHTGAVWPLFTGWVALAEARAGRWEAARRHREQIASLYRKYALGAFPEVLHGEEPRRIGVTPDQTWSTAMLIWTVGQRDVRSGRTPGSGDVI